MPVLDTFSKRQARLKGDVTDVYTYDNLPLTLRTQLAQIIGDMYGEDASDRFGNYTDGYKRWREMTIMLRREFGVDLLPPRDRHSREDFIAELSAFIKVGATDSQVLDTIDLFIVAVNYEVSRATNPAYAKAKQEILDEIATRFKEAGVGYSIENGRLFRMDSQLMHQEAVKPALVLLSDPLYAGAQQEFLSAFAHYRGGKNKEALTDALKAFESTMKIICNKRGWTVAANATAQPLIAACFSNGLIPAFWQSHFAGIRATLEAGVPTVRNKTSGHGQGTTLVEVPDHIANYVLHLTASTIIMLVNAEKALP